MRSVQLNMILLGWGLVQPPSAGNARLILPKIEFVSSVVWKTKSAWILNYVEPTRRHEPYPSQKESNALALRNNQDELAAVVGEFRDG